MTNILAPELVKRAIYSKYLMKRAMALLADGNELASAEAVLVAHDSVEMLMRVVADHVQVPLKRESTFMDFWNHMKTKVQKEPPLYAAMDQLNHQRVGLSTKGYCRTRRVSPISCAKRSASAK